MLTFEFTNLLGIGKGRVKRHFGGEVVIPWCDSRTAKVTIPLSDPICLNITPLDTMLRVYLDDIPKPVFWGIILTPVWKSGVPGESSVEVNAHDPTIWWKRNYHRYGDAAVDIGYEMSGVGLRILAESAIPLPNQMASPRNIPHPGIKWGTDTSSAYKVTATSGTGDAITYTYDVGRGPRPANLDAPVVGDGLWLVANRGQNVYDSISGMRDTVGAPEWSLDPDDTLAAGYYAKLNTANNLGTDKSDTLVFHKGTGRNANLASFVHTPDGNAVRNYWVEVYPGGETNRADSKHKGAYHSEASWQKYGIYEGWESSRNKDPNNVLLKKAQLYVRYYKNPPDYFEIEPLPTAPQYGHDYILGDVIRATCKDGYMTRDLTGRLREVTLTQPGRGEMETSMRCVPDVPGTEDSGGDGA